MPLRKGTPANYRRKGERFRLEHPNRIRLTNPPAGSRVKYTPPSLRFLLPKLFSLRLCDATLPTRRDTSSLHSKAHPSETHYIAWFERLAHDALFVDESAVGAVQVVKHTPTRFEGNPGVLSAHGRVGQNEGIISLSPDGQTRLGNRKPLPSERRLQSHQSGCCAHCRSNGSRGGRT